MDRASTTAEYMALFRALETARGRDRLFRDELAPGMLRPRYRWLARVARLPLGARGLARFLDWGWPGPRSSAVVRTRVIDDAIVAALADGIDQVLLLGAGLDCRGVRIPGIARARVFEVDHPTTQHEKRRRLAALGVPETMTFAALDLEGGGLPVALRDAGLDPARRSVAIWEGVTNYLEEPAVDRTLATLAEWMAEGSILIATYILPELARGSAASVAASRWAGRVRRVGERFRFASDPAAFAGRLARHGFEVCADESTAEAGRRLAATGARREPGSELYRVAVARRRCRG